MVSQTCQVRQASSFTQVSLDLTMLEITNLNHDLLRRFRRLGLDRLVKLDFFDQTKFEIKKKLGWLSQVKLGELSQSKFEDDTFLQGQLGSEDQIRKVSQGRLVQLGQET